MSDNWLQRWNDRYQEETYAYGESPNDYLKEKLSGLTPGKILFAAEGEGRNAVFAAKLGWDVSAFDISEEGKKKAMALAEKNGVSIDYRVGNLPELGFDAETFDAIALIYAHFPAEIKSGLNQLIASYLKKGGIVIFEAFGKNHLKYRIKNEKVGGPNDLESLFSTEEIQTDFPDFEFRELSEREIELSEGLYHNGTGSVIRAFGTKTNP